MKKHLLKSVVVFIACVTFVACSDTAEGSVPVPDQEEEVVKEAPPFAITIDEAEKTLEQILVSDNENLTKGGGITQIRRIKSRYTIGGEGAVTRAANGEGGIAQHPRVHVFNFYDNGGFAIMGADKRGAPMLVLTESGELTPGMTINNPSVAAAIAHAEAVYAQMIVEAGCDTTYVTSGVVVSAIVKDSLVVNRHGQCPVNWGQGYPYNQYCPIDATTGQQSVTGCVATAVAQLMAIHKYPSFYGAYTFNWNSMIAGTDNSGIASLMLLLGLPGNLNMSYGSNGSEALFSNVPQTLQNFGYSNPGTYANYNTDVILNYVIAGKPVLIAGTNSANTGHAWLGDGGRIIKVTTHVYNLQNGQYVVLGPVSSKYVHCNFGWDGYANGLYLSGHFDSGATHYELDNPYSNPINNAYNNNLKMVTGIAK
jgi:hypothetical protein